MGQEGVRPSGQLTRYSQGNQKRGTSPTPENPQHNNASSRHLNYIRETKYPMGNKSEGTLKRQS
jgi:hypothetical protein